ncbi:hypothetical protein DM02DRAFT_19612 [Periconia macrospinosa]|uniref:Uncharacterized protein n=1 Tax=Periconia macrospinosa TaxID=97972 RepID=A0A2V1DPF2_9PLEO|nr:hypothetical protein DM02DRAFT_19612 [Periconia macrospinosa]
MLHTVLVRVGDCIIIPMTVICLCLTLVPVPVPVPANRRNPLPLVRRRHPSQSKSPPRNEATTCHDMEPPTSLMLRRANQSVSQSFSQLAYIVSTFQVRGSNKRVCVAEEITMNTSESRLT